MPTHSAGLKAGVRRVLHFGLMAQLAIQGMADGSQAKQLFLHKLSDAAIERTTHAVRYVPDYVQIAYPNGDVPPDTGVCTDEIIRAYRALGIDLQKEVHEDMERHFSAYPQKWRWMKKRTRKPLWCRA